MQAFHMLRPVVGLMFALVLFSEGNLPVARPQGNSTGPASASVEVRWSGELKRIMMQGDLKGTIDLASLARLRNVFAVGALEGLRGEVTILDGQASISRVKNGKITVEESAKGKACVLVYAQVKNWKELPFPGACESLDQLETAVVTAAQKEGINVSRPFPFLIKGKVVEAKYHVLHYPGNLKDPHDLHDRAKVKFEMKDTVVELLGFYSDRHLGVFTCGGNLHVHVRSSDGKVSGHLEEVSLGKDTRLYLPIPLEK